MFRQYLPLLSWRRLQGQQWWWQWWWVVNFHYSDSSSVSSGCCKSYTLSATGAAAEMGPSLLSSYEATGEVNEGAPVFKKKYDTIYLYRHSAGTWVVGEYRVGTLFIRSVGTAQCPTGISQWQFWNDGDIWRSGDITAVCS